MPFCVSMKHSPRITLFMLGIFLAAQVVGLAVVAQYLDAAALREGKIGWEALPLGFERPEVEESISYTYIFIALLIGTALALILIKFRAVRAWKVWFFLAIALCLTISIAAVLPQIIAIILAVFLALWKIFRPNVLVHNFTEVLIYGGIAAIFVPILNLWSVSILFILIAIYDAIAVWHSKHMVKMAKFQSKANVFAGVLLPYAGGKLAGHKFPAKGKGEEMRIAVLGGGDIAFPLLFAGAAVKWLLPTYPLHIALLLSLIISVCATIALGALLFLAKPKKFYPAMPFIAAGCFVGLGLLWLVV